MSYRVEVVGVEKSYKDGDRKIEVLSGVDLAISPGEFVAIRGASGAGKSTLLHLVGSLLLPDKGDILIDGKNISDYAASGNLNLFRLEKVGFVFQHHYLMGDFTAVENVMIPLLLKGATRGEAKESAQSLLEKVGLASRMTHYPSQLSGGESQRVAVARALVGRPSVILADEPTGNLDGGNTEKLIALLSTLQEEYGLTILAVTHEEKLANAAHKSFVMREGKLFTYQGNP